MDPFEGYFEKRLRIIRIRSVVFRLLRLLAVLALVTYLLFGVVFGITVIEGYSMMPAVYNGDFVIYKRIFNTYSNGDIVLLKNSDEYHIKRIIASPGQTLDIDNKTHKPVLDGIVLSESYIYADTFQNDFDFPVTLGEDEYFVMGDNREHSKDSRCYGTVKLGQLIGKPLLFLRAVSFSESAQPYEASAISSAPKATEGSAGNENSIAVTTQNNTEASKRSGAGQNTSATLDKADSSSLKTGDRLNLFQLLWLMILLTGLLMLIAVWSFRLSKERNSICSKGRRYKK